MSSGEGELGPASREDEAEAGTPGAKLLELIRAGVSFSGRERHCAFLNTHDGRFADVSYTSGFDFPDDGRALALVDWDQDGDQDLWLSNRNGPQVRFLRNDAPADRHSVALALRGTRCNRDAIGARVELRMRGVAAPLLRSLQAGDAFVAQSSKVLHFGTGDATEVASVVVRWPGGESEAFSGVEVDGRYLLVQGSGVAAPLPARRPVQLEPSQLAGRASSDQGRCLLARPLPLPALEYRSVEGAPRSIAERTGKPLLLNLWASWCSPCVAELGEWTERQDELRAAGVQVVAVSVDPLGEDPEAGRQAMQATVRRLDLPFEVGLATPELVEQLQLVVDELFERHVALALPTSLLIDANGDLAVTYKGPLDIDVLLADLGRLELGPVRTRDASAAFPGRWSRPPVERRLVPFARHLAAAGFVDEAAEYLTRNVDRLGPNVSLSATFYQIGMRFWEEGREDAAIAMFRRAIAARDDMAKAHHALAVALEQRGQQAEAAEHFRRAADSKRGRRNAAGPQR